VARQREFDRIDTLDKALEVFWQKGYAATSTSDLLDAMQIGRQSMYDAFGDKRSLYLEALQRHNERASTTCCATWKATAALAAIDNAASLRLPSQA
jgi:AcrR family transcriptional regulator